MSCPNPLIPNNLFIKLPFEEIKTDKSISKKTNVCLLNILNYMIN